MVGRNIRSGRGEIDLLVRDGAALVAVEVKAGDDPLVHFTDDKAAAVRTAMRALRPEPCRLDLVTVEIGRDQVTIRWFRRVA